MKSSASWRKNRKDCKDFPPDSTVFLPYQTALDKELLEDYTIPQAVGLAQNTGVIEKAKARLKSTLDYLLDDSTMYAVEDAGSRIDALWNPPAQ